MKPQYAALELSFDSLIILAFIYMVPVFFLIWIFRMIYRGTREKRSMRAEIRRLTDEVEQLQRVSKL